MWSCFRYLAVKYARNTSINHTETCVVSENQQLGKELNRPIIWKIKNCKGQNGSDLAFIQLMAKYNKRARILLCVIDIYSKCA